MHLVVGLVVLQATTLVLEDIYQTLEKLEVLAVVGRLMAADKTVVLVFLV
jgi:hypothetical protein